MGHSKILIVGATGYIGKYIAKASARLGHPTFVLVRPSTASSPVKKELLDSFQAAGIAILHGDITDKESLVAALRQVDVVISTVNGPQVLDQLTLLEAIKEVGHIKRFLPSEFGGDPERSTILKQTGVIFKPKIQVRNAIRQAGVPYTLVQSNSFARWGFPVLGFPGPQAKEITIWGTGNCKAVFVDEEDIATFTIKAVDDPRTLNKQLVIRPQPDIVTLNELVALWEKKTGHELEKTYLPEDDLLKKIEETPFPENGISLITYGVLVKGEEYFELGAHDVEATELYPDVKCVTVDENFNKLLA